MKIIRDKQLATLTFVPVEAEEKRIIASIASMLKPEDKLSYEGRGRDGDDDKFCFITLHAGARHLRQTKINGNVTMRRSAYVGGLKLVLRGTTDEDKREVNRIRDTCFFGSGCLIFLGEIEVDGKKSIITTAMRCKHCGAGMIHFSRCEWKTCDACVAKCEHDYVRGLVHTGRSAGVGEFCSKCGCGKPIPEGTPEMSEREHHRTILKEGFLDAIIS